ncbi:MAG: VOC family protein [Acidimicrobiaceae bacterium]|nr:VOC family protein [Acidimicrobiaceae bacterium]
MSRVSTYLNFNGNADQAFEFYRKVFGTDYEGPVVRMGDMPDAPPVPDTEKNFVAHAALPILGGHVLQASDVLESMGQELKVGNNTTICLEPGTLEETHRLYDALSDGATDCAPPAEMPWGTWGTCLDRFGVRWMFNHSNEPTG